jgi:hypothetical protein
MEIKAVVEGKIITSQGVFARIKIKGLPKGSYHFFDIPDDGELSIGDKIELSIIRKANVTAPVVAIVPASLGQPIIFQPRATPSNSIDILLPEGPNYYAPEDAGSDAPGVDIYQERADALGISRIAAKAEVMGPLYASHTPEEGG